MCVLRITYYVCVLNLFVETNKSVRNKCVSGERGSPVHENHINNCFPFDIALVIAQNYNVSTKLYSKTNLARHIYHHTTKVTDMLGTFA